MVRVRTIRAGKLGFGRFIDLGYRHMRRVDYAASDVITYRDQVRLHVTPLVRHLYKQRCNGKGGARSLRETNHW